METSITQLVIKHSQRPLREGSSLLNSKEIRGIRERKNLGKENNERWYKCDKSEKTSQSYQPELGTRDDMNVASLLQHHQEAGRLCRENNSVDTSEVTSRKQADSAGWVQVGAGVAAAGWGLICSRVGDILSLLIIV